MSRRRGVVSGVLLLFAASGCSAASDAEVDAVRPSSRTTADVAHSSATTGQVTSTTVVREPGLINGVGVRDLGLDVGDCFAGEFPRNDADFNVVDCDEPHDSEVIAVVDHPAPEGAPYPGNAELANFTDQRCAEAFARYVGESIQGSPLQVGIMEPRQERWEELDDRSFLCMLIATGDQLVGSQQGTGSRPAPAGDERVVNLLVPGDCFVKPEAQPSFAVSVLPCTEPHDSEVYAVFDAPASDYPGDAEIESIGRDRCVAEFAEYVGLSFEQSRLDAYSFKPSAQSWASGDRRFVCRAPTGRRSARQQPTRGRALTEITRCRGTP